MAQQDYSALPAAHRAGGRSDSRSVPERHQHPPVAWSTGTAVARRPAIEGRGIAPGRRLREDCAAWDQRDLGELKVRYLFLDGWYPWVRIGKKRVRVPVLITMGVCVDGCRVILDLRLAGVESERAWLDAIQSLVARNLGAPMLAVIDGNPGLAAALKAQWPKLALQRCTNHKLWNLLARAPAHLREELAEDYRRMIYAESRAAAEQARVGFVRKWRLHCKAHFKLRGSWRRTVHFYCLPGFPMEGPAHDQRAGADQRGVSAANQDPGFAPERGGGPAPLVRTVV